MSCNTLKIFTTIFHFCFSLIHGVGEVDIQNKDEKEERDASFDEEQPLVPEVESLPYLLLDVRDEDAYKQSHIIGGEYFNRIMFHILLEQPSFPA